ncbi:T9SS type A sorting domain-containing protein [Chryseobacterium wangxinyae]|uniref:DUF7619 domain-containing protein n=1 Tax=Chryseobacterium sp. CY350 TaxID=2997336 RepID=UPI002270D18A|nr:T9SS type A sorting domain-containing protein [Chryseobacterium sp. CY350]MCY0976997.1 T9SS type A sorting domain-containing protein [Chryseobacterium sp. CY350]WBZ96997.1 T9SS type A sorting domain-containing protein [Chryseobacterium sp. CY350]
MKNIYLLATLLFCSSFSSQIVNIPDANFKAKLVSANQWNFIANDLIGNMTVIDTNGDGQIQVSEAANISQLTLNQTQIHDLTGLQSFSNLQNIVIQGNTYIDEVNVSNLAYLKNLSLIGNGIDLINTQGCTQLEYVNLTNNSGFLYNLNFLQSNISSLKKLKLISNQHLSGVDLTSLINLEELDISGTSHLNTAFTSLNLANNVNLKKIIIEKPNLTSLTLNPLSQLLEFTLQKTPLTSLNLSSAGIMEYLHVADNALMTSINIQNSNGLENILVLNCPLITSLGIQNKPNLTSMSLGGTGVTSLNFTGTPGIGNLAISNNALTSLDLSPITSLAALNLNENISSLDVSQNTMLQGMSVNGLGLTYVNAKNGNPNLQAYLGSSVYSPNLAYVCCDTNLVQTISNQLLANGHTNVQVNSYCSFAPGGTVYTLQGNTKYDIDNNGCNSTDLNKPLQQFNISGNGTSGSYVTNAMGNYSIPVQSGSYTITPVMENPTYFSISPTSLNANFPTQTSPLSQNFCLTANGNHNDLEILIIPITTARPGFNSKYKIIYKNKGTTTQSGTLVYNYNDNLMNYLSSTLAPNSQSTGVLNWNFANLLPFESREFTLTFTLNTPTQTPPLLGGNILNYTAQINAATDETPLDNTFVLNQTVVNSFDPNDKTCLQGATITTSQVGNYVHYLIRFENTGTANAQNIVVKDEIDVSKYDLSTLQPLSGSHDFVTQITSPNIVEFIFENIQLPFADATNDGYISFKIKTKSTLTIGDSFSNTAKIYFDYNHPIVTNTYTTSVQNVLGTSEITKDKVEVGIYPNPVKDILYFKSKEKIVKAEIYDSAGRITNSLGVKDDSINLSELPKGNYIIKFSTKNQSVSQKFIKE